MGRAKLHLPKAELERESGVIREALLARAVQVLTTVEPGPEGSADVRVVVEVADAGAADPAVGMVPIGFELVRGAEAELRQLLVEGVLVGEEAGQRWNVLAGDGVVVADEQQPATEALRKGTDALQERGDELALALDLLGTTIARRHVYAHNGQARRAVEHDGLRPPGKRDGDLYGQFLADGEATGDQDASVPPVRGRVGREAISLEPAADQLGAGARACLAEDDEVVASAPQPAEYPLGTRLGRRRDVEGEEPCSGDPVGPPGQWSTAPAGNLSRWQATALQGLCSGRHQADDLVANRPHFAARNCVVGGGVQPCVSRAAA